MPSELTDRLTTTVGPAGPERGGGRGLRRLLAGGGILAPRRRSGSEGPTVDGPSPGAGSSPTTTGQTAVLTQMLAVEPPGQRSATVLCDQADLIAACDAALANRDLVGGDIALAVFELVDADTIVDRLGPDAVDDVSRQTVRRLRAWLPPQDTVARLSATTFAVLLEGLGDEGPGPQLRRLQALLAEPMTSGQGLGAVDFAVGLALRQDGSTGAELVLEALRATTRDEPGPPTVVAQTEAGGDARLEQAARALAEALRSGTVQAVFRPVLRLDDPTRMAAIQVLPRWSRSRGTDPGTTFDPERIAALAADTGLGAELRRQLTERGLDAVSSWYAAGFAVGRLALRLDQDALADPELANLLTDHVERRHLPTGCLVVEVGAADLSDAALARPVLTALRGRGIEIVVAGVVAPQAALGLLTSLPISGISLHRALVDQLTGGSSQTADTARKAVAEARRRGLRVIAEGVSSLDQLRRLPEYGVDAAWGSAVAPATRARDISARLSAERRLLLKD